MPDLEKILDNSIVKVNYLKKDLMKMKQMIKSSEEGTQK